MINIYTMQKLNKTIIMGPIGESDYGFYCDIEKEHQTYPKQNVKMHKLNTILEYTPNSSQSSNKLKFDDFKNEITNINLKTIFMYILVSVTSIYITSRLFYKHYS